MPYRHDSVGGGGSSRIFRDLKKSMRFSGGGGGGNSRIFFPVISPKAYAIQWGGGGGSSINFSWSPKAYAFRWRGGGGSGAEFFFSLTSKRHFPLMGPFYIFLLSRRGGPGPPGPPPPESATAFCSNSPKMHRVLRVARPFNGAIMMGDIPRLTAMS